MKRIAMPTGLLTVAALIVLGALSAGSASAAPQFLWTGPLPGLLLILSDNKQFFRTEPGGLFIECEHFGGHGVITNGILMYASEVIVTGLYTKCKASTGNAVFVSPIKYLLTAEGTVSVLNSIVLTIPAAACSLKVSSGGANQNLKTITYLPDGANSSAQLVHAQVSGIHSEGSGGAVCGEPGIEKTSGEYRGLLLVRLDGGSITWDP